MPILRHGTEAQQAEWLGAIARGQVMSYVAGGDGDDPAGGVAGPALGGVRAEPSGDGFVLDGEGSFVPYAEAAGQLLVTARHAGDPIAAVVDASAPGVRREPLDVIAGPMGQVRFERVAVSGARVIGGVAGSAAAAAAVTDYGTAAVCAEMVGGAQGVLDLTVAYAREREQFGQPIGAFQAVAHHCADMAIDVLASRLIAYEAIWRLAEGLDATVELSLAKSWVSDAYQRVCALGHQVHGAIGFTAEHDLHYFSRHAMASALAFGAAGFHTERVAAHLGI
jgi:alkylation response protein AidB-like acyl-CoA dehydrogenase